MKPVSTKSALAAAVKAARAAGKVMHVNWHKPKRVNSAEAHDIKLELDVRCQALIERILAAGFPQIPVLGEEGSTGDTTAEYRWVIDPIDGTVNYFYGMPHAAVSIALQHRGKSVVGVIYDPFTDELWTTTKGEPTRLNGKIIRVSDRSQINDCVIAMGFSKSKENLKKSLPHLIRISKQCKKIRIMGSAALELAYVASGRLDAYIERTINLWDVAAGQLLVDNAGGEFYSAPAPNGKMRMCADNGKLRKKLQIASLLK
ncbi:MAG: inositol monophosphatase family protein [Verrucomicrobiae bacterium]|nr:inositol monophosphatase family protein [Verrucomicrobiae bacterium]